MRSTIERIDTWHKTRKGRLMFGALELVLAYIVASLAIDTGSLLQYAVATALVIGATINLIEAIKISAKPHAKLYSKKR